MNPGRNIKKRKKMTAAATLALFVGAAFLVAVPAGALGVLGSGSGAADAIWGSYAGLEGDGAGADSSASGAASAAADAAGGADVDAQPVVDAASDAAMDAAASAEAEANGAAQTAAEQQVEAHPDLDYGIDANGDGTYNVKLGGDAAGSVGDEVVDAPGLGVDEQVDTRMASDAAGDAEVEANGVLGMFEGLWNDLSLALDLHGAWNAIASMGVAINGIGEGLGFNAAGATDAVGLGQLDLHQQLDTPDLHTQLDLPDVPQVELHKSGDIAMDAAASAEAAAQGAISGP
jgi:hypothetical protein